MSITLAQLTNGDLNSSGDWEGTGVFDKLISAVNKNIESQAKKGRVTGADYATMYVGAMQYTLRESMEFLLHEPLKEKELEKLQAEINLLQTQNSELLLNGASERALKSRAADLADAKQAESELTSDKQRLVLEAQKALYNRQIQGFDDNKLQKLFESQISSWGLMFSSGMLTEKPAFITGTEVTDLYNKMIKDA